MNNRHEQIIIGGILKGVIKTDDVGLMSSDFNTLGAFFSLCREIENDGLKPDAQILYERAANLDSLEMEWFSLADIKSLTALPLSATSCLSAARVLRQTSLKEDLTAQCAELFLDTEKLSGADLLKKIKAICEQADSDYSEIKGGFQHLKEITPEVAKVYQDLHAGVSYCVPTGFSAVDDAILDGFSRGDEHLIVGFTGAGKSSLALTFALHQAKNGYPVGIVSREMSRIENVIRMQVAETRTPRWHIRKGLYGTEYDNLMRNLPEFEKLPIFINTETSAVEDLPLQVKMLCESEGLGILYVDYLQLLSSSAKHSTRANEVQKISRTLKLIAMDNNIPVVSLCQFNRSALQASVFEIMYQLKESSGLEQDASTILFVEVEQTQEKKQVRSAKVTVLKNRNGTPFNPISLEFIGELFTFNQV